MDGDRKRITSGILAVLAAAVVACGSTQGASGQADLAPGGGQNYLTDDGGYGRGVARPDVSANYPPQEQDVPEFLLKQSSGTDHMSGASPTSGDTTSPMLQP